MDPSGPLSLGGVPTCVFWDIHDCKIVDGVTVAEVSRNITRTLSNAGIDGTEVSIRAYGDGRNDDFNSAGIPLTYSPAGEKGVRHTQILRDLLSWVEENPPPANMVLMIGATAREFEDVIHLLQSNNYRYLSVQPGDAGSDED